MRLRWLSFILICFLMSCSGSGDGSDEDGFGGDDCTYPVIVGHGFADRYLIRINGVIEEIPAPLKYPLVDFKEGGYFVQLSAVWNEQIDYPVNFNLYVWADGYEIEPLNWPENFDVEYLILEMK